MANFGFSPGVEDFDLRSQSSEVASTSATTGFNLAFKKRTSSTAFQIFSSHFAQTLDWTGWFSIYLFAVA